MRSYAASPASRRDRIRAVTPPRKPPSPTLPEWESRGLNGPLVVESRGGNASFGQGIPKGTKSP